MVEYASWPQQQPSGQPQIQQPQAPLQPQVYVPQDGHAAPVYQPQGQPQGQPQPQGQFQGQGQPQQYNAPQAQAPVWLTAMSTPVVEMPRSGLPLCRGLWHCAKAELSLNRNSAVLFRAELLLRHVFAWINPNDPMQTDPRLNDKPFFAYLNLTRRGGEPLRHFVELLCVTVAGKGFGIPIDPNVVDIAKATGANIQELQAMTPATENGQGRSALCYAFLQRDFICSTKSEKDQQGASRIVMDWESIEPAQQHAPAQYQQPQPQPPQQQPQQQLQPQNWAPPTAPTPPNSGSPTFVPNNPN